MEELKKRYIRTFLIFIVLMCTAVSFLRSQLDTMTEAQKTQVAQEEKQKAHSFECA